MLGITGVGRFKAHPPVECEGKESLTVSILAQGGLLDWR